MQKKMYIVRANRAGLFFGEIKSKNDKSIVMTNVRKIFYWDGAAAPEQLALEGVKKPQNCKLTVIIPEMEIAEPIQIIACTKESVNSLKNIPIWKM